MSVGTIYENFDDLKSLIERHKNEKVPCKNYEFDGTGYALMLKDINKLLQENQQLKKQKEINDNLKQYIQDSSLEVATKEYGMLIVCNSDDLLQILEDKGELNMDNYNKIWSLIRNTDLLNYDEKNELHLYLIDLKKQKEIIDKIKLIIKRTAYGGNEDYYIGRMKEILSILEDKEK